MPRPDTRLIEVMLCSERARADVLDVLEAAGLDYPVSDRTDESSASGLVSVPIPASTVESLLGPAVVDQLAGVEMQALLTE